MFYDELQGFDMRIKEYLAGKIEVRVRVRVFSFSQ